MTQMPMSSKQLESYRESNARINIWQGAVRSGKTFSSLLRFLKFLQEGPQGNAMIVGVTRDSIQRNILGELCGFVGAKIPASRSTEMRFLNRNVYFVGANDESAVRRIQGSTIAVAYVDEAASIPEPFFNMLLSRLSITGAQLFATLNPEGPAHWLKTRFIDHKNKLDLKAWRFTLDDNPSLDETYKNNLKAEYTGHWYKRFILGEWSVAHGLIYDGWTNDNLQTPSVNPQFYAVGLDYGASNPTACVLGAISPSTWPQIYIKDTYIYDAAKAGRGKTDAELADAIEEWLKPYNIRAIYADPSALSMRLELQRRGFHVIQGKNDVIQGIRTVSKFISGKNIVVNPSCKQLIDELQTYAWDPKAASRGEDKPVKKDDHLCFVSGTMITTEHGDSPIEDIREGDLVLTRKGYRKVVCTGFSESSDIWKMQWGDRELVGTGDHPIITDKGKVPLKSMDGVHSVFMTDAEGSCQIKRKLSSSTESYTADILSQKEDLTPSTIGVAPNISRWDMDTFTGMCGSVLTVPYQKDSTSTILTGIRQTILLATSFVFPVRSISKFIRISKGLTVRMLKWKWSSSFLSPRMSRPKPPSLNANTAPRNIYLSGPTSAGIAAQNVGPHTEGWRERTYGSESVRFVVSHIRHIRAASRRVVQNAGISGMAGSQSSATPCRVISVALFTLEGAPREKGKENKDFVAESALLSTKAFSTRVLEKNSLKHASTVTTLSMLIGASENSVPMSATRKACDYPSRNVRNAPFPFSLQSQSTGSVAENVHQERVVYNIEVEDAHEYFANGLLVSNCDSLRYLVYTLYPKSIIRDLDNDYNYDSVMKRINGPSSSLSELFDPSNSYM